VCVKINNMMALGEHWTRSGPPAPRVMAGLGSATHVFVASNISSRSTRMPPAPG